MYIRSIFIFSYLFFLECYYFFLLIFFYGFCIYYILHKAESVHTKVFRSWNCNTVAIPPIFTYLVSPYPEITVLLQLDNKAHQSIFR